MKTDRELLDAFTPTGALRAAINLGNPILANTHSDGGAPGGVSVDLATELARWLNVKLELALFKSAGESVAAVAAEQADVGFFAIDPLRGEQIAFTAPYLVIEGAYLVRQDSPITRMQDVDRVGQRVAVGLGSAYDLYLTRELKYAEIFRAPSSPLVVDTFVRENLEVAAGVKQQLQADAQRLGGLRLLAGRFMSIRQAMGAPKRRGVQASAYLSAFVEAMKQSGFVAEALARHNIQGAAVAPPAAAPQ